MFRVLAALSAVAFTAASVIDSAELLPVPNEYKFHARPAHGISDPGSPWITGPKNNKYQFHIGRQSWLAAREHCLAQNSDLVVIQDAEELNWVLSHYAPALPHFIERLIQVGLYIDSHDGIREWHWTNHKSLNTSALAWISGEPFDHANGHERCAVLRVNAAALDDVDCDLPGSETKMYRFICQRSHEAHVKHEEVNNPLWKKLQDILDFFGISRPTGDNNSSENKTRPGEDEEDYWEMVKKENITDVDNTLNATETTIAAIKEVIESVEVLEGSGEEVTDSVPDGTSAPVQTHGAKTSENAVIADELLINDSLQKINSAEEAATTDAPATPLKKEEVIIETASVETTRTTKPDPLEKPTPKKSKDQIHYVDVLQKHMDKLEKIVNAVEHMIGPLTDDDSEEEGDLGEIAESKNDNNTEATIPEMAEIIADDMANMEEDFQEAALETKEHPGINSGDFVAVPNEHQENIELCENDEDETTPAPTRAQKIEKFLTSLQRFLNRSSNKKLKDLVDESKLKGKSLLEKIDEAVMEQTAEQLQKMIEVQGNLTDRVPHKKHEKNNVTEKASTAATTVSVEKVTEVTNTVIEDSTTAATETVETTSTDAVETSTIAIQEVISKVTAEVELYSSTEANTETSVSASDETTAAAEVETSVTEKANSEETGSTQPETTSTLASPVEEVTSSENEASETESTTTEKTESIESATNSTSAEPLEEVSSAVIESSETESTTIAKTKSTESAITSTSEEPLEVVSPDVTETSESELTTIAKTESTESAITSTSEKPVEETSPSVTETPETNSTTIAESTTINTPIAEEPLSKPEGSDNTITDSRSTLAPAPETENTTSVVVESVTAEAATSQITSIEESESSEPSSNQTVLQVTKENITEVSKKSRSEQKKAEIKKHSETESLFPTPDFSLIKPGQGIPEDVLKSVQEEALKIGAAYEEFNRRMDTSKIVQHIQDKEKDGVLKNKPVLDSLPLSSRAEKRDPTNVEKKALLELEKMFVELGKNFQAISQG